MNEQDIADLVGFVNDTKRADLRQAAITGLVPYSNEESTRKLFLKHAVSLMGGLTKALSDTSAIQGDAYSALINLCQEETFVHAALASSNSFMKKLYEALKDTKHRFAESNAMLLSNVTKVHAGAVAWMQTANPDDAHLYAVTTLSRFVAAPPSLPEGAKKPDGGRPYDPYRWLGTVLQNLTQIQAGRRWLLTGTKKPLIAMLYPYTKSRDLIRRGGAIGAMRNVCGERPTSERVLNGTTVEGGIVPTLIAPLLGPEPIEPDSDGTCVLPAECSALQVPGKKRETVPELRKFLVEGLAYLTGLGEDARNLMRASQVYEVIRDLHKDEADDEVKEVCENLVNILTSDEDLEGDELAQAESAPSPRSLAPAGVRKYVPAVPAHSLSRYVPDVVIPLLPSSCYGPSLRKASAKAAIHHHKH